MDGTSRNQTPRNSLAQPEREPPLGLPDPASSTVASQVLRSVIAMCSAMGVAEAALIHTARLDAARLHDPRGRFTFCEIYQLCEAVIALTGDHGCGLRWANAIDDRTLAPISHLVHHAPTLRAALAALRRFHALVADDLGWSIHELDDSVVVRISHPQGAPLAVERMLAEMQLCGVRHLIRGYAREAQLRDVSCRYPEPAYVAAYHTSFSAPVRFDQAYTGLRFARALLDQPALSPDAEMFETLHGLAERRVLSINARAPFALRLREHVVRGGWRRRDDMDAAARSLGVSVRTLRRRLADENTSFSAVVGEAMAVVATDLLRDPRRTIQEAAFELGFSEASTFHRAFRRWTGTTPNAFRRGL